MSIKIIDKYLTEADKDKIFNCLYNQSFNLIMALNDFWYWMIIPIRKILPVRIAVPIVIQHISIKHYFLEKYKKLSIWLNKVFY